VKLDIFHWLQRWNPILNSPQSVEAGIFRALMSRAVLVASQVEYHRVHDKLSNKIALGKQQGPLTVSEVLRHCKTAAVPKEKMEHLVLTHLRYYIKKDAETELHLATLDENDTATSRPSLVLKAGNKTESVIRSQLSHIRNNCLSDDVDFNLYKEVNGNWCCARGSSKNERNNRSLQERAFATSIGIKAAERRTWIEFDRHNASNNERRCGAVGQYTSNHEGCALLNSLAADCRHDLPFKHLSMASQEGTIPEDHREKIGYELYHETADNMQSESTSGNEESEEDEEDVDHELDVIGAGEDSAPIETPEERADRFNADFIEEQQDALHDELTQQCESAMNQVDSQRYIRPAENTMDAFKRLAGDAIWTPFEKDKDASPQAKAEHELFVQMADNYDRNAKPSSTKGYNAFQKAWCQEAGRRMFADLEQGGNNKPAIRYKTRDQLQEYCDYLKELESMATETTIDESSGRHDLMSTLRQARLEQSEPIVRQATPVHYAPSTVAHIPLGHPLQMANVPWYSHNVNRQQSVANVAPYRVHATPPHPLPRPDQAVCQQISDG
jgi:hypothetical protein